MSHLPYHAYSNFGTEALTSTHYSQAVVVPSTGSQIHISGQGGWDPSTTHADFSVSTSLPEEIDRAFANVDLAVRDAGGTGIEQVYKLIVYAAPLSEKGTKAAIDSLRKWFPNHKPCLTFIGVEKLALPGMHIEVDASAHLPQRNL